MNKDGLIKMSKTEDKSCNNCAYLKQNGGMILGPRRDFSLRGVGHTIGVPTVIGFGLTCKANNSSVNENEVKTKFCNQFLLKKEGMTLEQQLEEVRQQKEIEEKNRLEKEKQEEYKKFSNRLRRNWYYVCALTIATLSLIVAIWKLLF